MSLLRPCPVPARQLTWRPADREFVGEISSTHGFGRVYDDACDEGLTLVSDTTGREVVFVVEHVEIDEEGDIAWWRLVPADRSGVDARLNTSIRLFND